MYRVQKIVPDNQDKAYGIDEIDSDPYEDKPIEDFKLPNDKEVMQNAYNDVYDIINAKAITHNSRAKELDRVAARDYANNPNNTPHNSKYAYFANCGGDCANFISQCYYEGGLSTDNEWYMYSVPWKNVGGSQSNTAKYCGLSDYMQNNGIVFWVPGSSINQAFAGSIIYWQHDTVGGHVAIVTSNDGREMRCSAHTNNKINEVMYKPYYSQNCDFLIPCWDSWSGTWTR